MSNGSKIKHDIIAIAKLINKSIPIEEVPAWFEIDKVPKDPIVVSPLKKTAFGVLLKSIKSTLL